jgi:hypothetical protein
MAFLVNPGGGDDKKSIDLSTSKGNADPQLAARRTSAGGIEEATALTANTKPAAPIIGRMSRGSTA